MIRAILFSTDDSLAAELREALTLAPQLQLVRSVTHYLDGAGLARLSAAEQVDVLYTAAGGLDALSELLRAAAEFAPNLSIVVFGRSRNPEMLIDLLRLGIKDYLMAPFHPGQVTESVRRIMDARQSVSAGREGELYAFLPAKAGVGSSTLAVNTAAAISVQPAMPTLLADFDLNSGMVRFMLKLSGERSVLDAADRSSDLDHDLWPQLVTRVDSLDVLHAGEVNPNRRIAPEAIQRLMGYARRNYRAICADLSGNLERYSFEVMGEARHIYLVCTPELPTLHLAREKARFLRECGLGTRVSLLMNRHDSRSTLSHEQVEELVGAPIAWSLPNDYTTTQRALTAGKTLESGRPLSRAIHTFAQSLTNINTTRTAPSPRRFLQFFSVARRQSAT